jgi:hypothetical protein
MNWLLLFVPIAIGLELLAPDRHLLVFVTSSLALLPLAMWLGRATEQLAERMGEGVGGALLHGSTAGRSQPPAATFYVRRTYSGRPSSSIRFSEAAAIATSVVCRPPVRERSASPITRL